MSRIISLNEARERVELIRQGESTILDCRDSLQLVIRRGRHIVESEEAFLYEANVLAMEISICVQSMARFRSVCKSKEVCRQLEVVRLRAWALRMQIPLVWVAMRNPDLALRTLAIRELVRAYCAFVTEALVLFRETENSKPVAS